MPDHPFERLSTWAARASALSLLAAWLLLTLLLAAVVPAEHGAQLVRFLGAADARGAAAIVAAWSPDMRATAGFVIGFDFLYDLVHDNAVALLCIWAARLLGGARVMLAARVVAWTMWLAVLLNLPENLLAIHIVRDGAATDWFGVVVAITSFRFVTLWAGLAFGVAALVVAQRRAALRAG